MHRGKADKVVDEGVEGLARLERMEPQSKKTWTLFLSSLLSSVAPEEERAASNLGNTRLLC